MLTQDQRNELEEYVFRLRKAEAKLDVEFDRHGYFMPSVFHDNFNKACQDFTKYLDSITNKG